jgi:diguanylate cyclase (GGDEF)-like protein
MLYILSEADMETQIILIVSLGILVVILAALLLTRIRKERRQTTAMRRMNLAEFSDFLRTNSLDGTIQGVASKVSDLLKKPFGCEVIVFLRKKRHLLELNYYHGIRGFDRREFRFVFNRQLAQRLQEDFLPRNIQHLKDDLPAPFYRKLHALKVDMYFPIFWRDNLYGLYFIHSTIETGSASFNLLIAGLAQSLSAAYHIKWHEMRYGSLQKELDDVRIYSRRELKVNERLHANILKLMRHRDSETMVPRLIGSIKQDLGMSRVAYLYQDRENAAKPLVFQTGVTRNINVPDGNVFRAIFKALDKENSFDLDELAGRETGLRDWARNLKENGLKYMEEMSYTDNLTGLANQRYLSKRLDEEISRAKRYNRKLALIFFDLDDLKTTNDKYGHLAGDAVLRQVGQILRKNVRTIDIVARYGGDEFCIIMPEANATTCVKFMDRLKAEVSNWEFAITSGPCLTGEGLANRISCTISQGGAVFPEHADNPKQLFHAADTALMKAKESGRNTSLLYHSGN